MSDMPLVSVVIPCYNHEKYVQDCIQSVINQTYQNIELIIIDDGSGDQSVQKIKDILDKCKERFVRVLFFSQENRGLTASLNRALKHVNGAFYVVFAGDDIMLNERIEKQVSYLVNDPTIYACSGSQIKINSNGSFLDSSKQNNILPKVLEKDIKNIFEKSNNIYSPTTMFRLDVIKNLGGYEENIEVEDLYIFYLAALEGYKHKQVTDIFTYYRVHTGNNHKRYIWMYENKMKILDDFKSKGYKNLEKLERLILLESFYSISRYSDDSEKTLHLFFRCIRYFYSPYFIAGLFFLLRNFLTIGRKGNCSG